MVKERLKKLKRKVSASIKKNKGNVNMTKLGIECGYSKEYAKSGQMKKTKTWQEIMDKYLPEELVANTHSELMKAARLQSHIFSGTGKGKNKVFVSDEEIKKLIESIPGCKLLYITITGFRDKIAFYISPDHKNRKGAIEMAYSLRGKFAPQEIKLTRPFADLSDKELTALIKSEKDKLNKKK